MTARRVAVVAIAVVITVVAIAYFASRGPARGPLQPTSNVNSFGLPVADGSTMSMVVELRGETATDATLRGVSLVSPDEGLALVDSGILVGGYPGTYISDQFPLGSLTPVAGSEISTDPTDPSKDVFINLGIKPTFGETPLSARGVWLDYDVAGVRYRALLPWLVTLCKAPTTETCTGINAEQFSFPP
jgi:hypothetical protein